MERRFALLVFFLATFVESFEQACETLRQDKIELQLAWIEPDYAPLSSVRNFLNLRRREWVDFFTNTVEVGFKSSRVSMVKMNDETELKECTKLYFKERGFDAFAKRAVARGQPVRSSLKAVAIVSNFFGKSVREASSSLDGGRDFGVAALAVVAMFVGAVPRKPNSATTAHPFNIDGSAATCAMNDPAPAELKAFLSKRGIGLLIITANAFGKRYFDAEFGGNEDNFLYDSLQLPQLTAAMYSRHMSDLVNFVNNGIRRFACKRFPHLVKTTATTGGGDGKQDTQGAGQDTQGAGQDTQGAGQDSQPQEQDGQRDQQQEEQASEHDAHDASLNAGKDSAALEEQERLQVFVEEQIRLRTVVEEHVLREEKARLANQERRQHQALLQEQRELEEQLKIIEQTYLKAQAAEEEQRRLERSRRAAQAEQQQMKQHDFPSSSPGPASTPPALPARLSTVLPPLSSTATSAEALRAKSIESTQRVTRTAASATAASMATSNHHFWPVFQIGMLCAATALRSS